MQQPVGERATTVSEKPNSAAAKSGYETLMDLESPGRYLFFVDETGTSGEPLPNLASDFQLFCGVGFPSLHYAALKASLLTKLRSIDSAIEEFHATEIVNPKRTSHWHSVSVAERQDALRHLSDCLLGLPSILVFSYVSGKQYEEIREKTKRLAGVSLSQKSALQKVFLSSLFDHVREHLPTDPVAIVADTQKRLGSEIEIHSYDGAPQNLYEDGVIVARSEVEPGLQIADFAAYLMNRCFHSYHRVMEGRMGPFDQIILDAYRDMQPRTIDLLARATTGT